MVFVQALADPTLVYALFVAGIIAALVEVLHPGAIVPGVVGALCIVLAVIGFSLLPLNWLALLLIVAGLGLFVVDVHVAAHGGLTAVGLIAFIIGSFSLYAPRNTHAGHVVVSNGVASPVILMFALIGLVLCTLIVRASVRTRHAAPMTGPQLLLGQIGVVTSALQPVGTVRVAGELWSARLTRRMAMADSMPQNVPELPSITSAPTEIDGDRTAPVVGQYVRVVGRKGLVLEVEPVFRPS